MYRTKHLKTLLRCLSEALNCEDCRAPVASVALVSRALWRKAGQGAAGLERQGGGGGRRRDGYYCYCYYYLLVLLLLLVILPLLLLLLP